MIATTELRWCDGCQADAPFEEFDCTDHAGDCLELVCTGCGGGIERRAHPGVGAAAPRRARREVAA